MKDPRRTVSLHRLDTYRFSVALSVVALSGCSLSPEERLGERLFEDQSLSANGNQACSSCHDLATGGTGPDSSVNQHGAIYEGSVAGRFGNRKPPSTTYATVAPRFEYSENSHFTGGNFWDGRATGWRLGSPAADQAQGPYLNPVEQALPDASELVARVCQSDYGPLFRKVHGTSACTQVEEGYAAVARSVSIFEDSRNTNPFSSLYDAWRAGKASLGDRASLGLQLFRGKAQCANCHTSDGSDPVFTDFTFDNLGIPPNPENPFYQMSTVIVDGHPVNPAGAAWVDQGLAAFLESLVADEAWRALPYVTPNIRALPGDRLLGLAQESRGKFRVPTLRNVDRRPYPEFVKAYGHNGFFKSLKSIVHFYNTRDVLPGCTTERTEAEALAANCWPAPEIAENLNRTELGNLQLTNDEEDALVALLETLSD